MNSFLAEILDGELNKIQHHHSITKLSAIVSSKDLIQNYHQFFAKEYSSKKKKEEIPSHRVDAIVCDTNETNLTNNEIVEWTKINIIFGSISWKKRRIKNALVINFLLFFHSLCILFCMKVTVYEELAFCKSHAIYFLSPDCTGKHQKFDANIDQ